MSQNNNLADDPNQNPRVTWEGCSVLLDINDSDRLVFARLTAASTLTIGNKKYPLQPLIGCPFGSLFQVENGKEGQYLSRVFPTAEGDNVEEKGCCQIKDESKDNRGLVDNNTAQSLSSEDIDSMRRQGATGDEIVQALIANSATFEKKTSFSQEKYRLKKQKKYAPKVLLRRPFTRSICETYFKKYPERIGRHSLLLATVVLELYFDGTGYVCNSYLGLAPYPMDIIRMFNFSSETCRRIARCSLTDLCSSQNGIPVGEPGEPHNIETQSQVRDTRYIDAYYPMVFYYHQGAILYRKRDLLCAQQAWMKVQFLLKTGCWILSRRHLPLQLLKHPKLQNLERRLHKSSLAFGKRMGFQGCLIIAAPDVDAWSIVSELLPFLSFSAPFAIYHQYIQPLATCMHNLQLRKMAVGLQISEPWLREYQVLPSRTHPLMQMSAFGGYILSGTKIRTEDQLQLK
ncbi:hypothetical protein RHGRI_015946 [Rhododendron griersonianum]|uniref:tRNA (adenine(58)-N(1))-methyltransferase non-catalytic subunit TRM6 n=2 Tax=Rhododendron griersonianum TaxID=479676 RepID=A0AAV6JPB0_9ERIC|nr:hypothetical protein RHGRI_015946 [Rhododendron griersonianum]